METNKGRKNRNNHNKNEQSIHEGNRKIDLPNNLRIYCSRKNNNKKTC